MAFSGDFTPLLHKHTANLQLVDSVSIAVDRIYRGLSGIGDQITSMRQFGLSDNDARLLIYRAFMEKAMKGISRSLMPLVHDYYFEPHHDEFRPRNLWSLSNAFTSAFKTLAPLKQFEATAKLAAYLVNVHSELLSDPDSDKARPNSMIDKTELSLVGAEELELKEECIDNQAPESKDTGDTIDMLVGDQAARAAA